MTKHSSKAALNTALNSAGSNNTVVFLGSYFLSFLDIDKSQIYCGRVAPGRLNGEIGPGVKMTNDGDFDTSHIIWHCQDIVRNGTILNMWSFGLQEQLFHFFTEHLALRENCRLLTNISYFIIIDYLIIIAIIINYYVKAQN